ncbi:hypothetical protein B0H10DRAFT_2038796 [Mycena sp. CBHHK59/15]|nr:hypothetical protein B0H10DRAFT_2038796 [Mycena sp. CBHHK59/15]
MLICLLLLFREAHPSPPSMPCARKRAARRGARLSKEAAKDVANASNPDTDEAALESIGCKKSSRNPKHGRSSSSLQAHRNKYLKPGGAYDNGQRYWMKHTERITAGSAFPADFLAFAKNAAMVVETVHEKYPGDPHMLPLFSTNDKNIVLISSPPPGLRDLDSMGPGGIGKWLERKLSPKQHLAFEEDGMPPFEVGRFPGVITPYVQKLLLKAFDRLKALKPEYGPIEPQRSMTPAQHFGIWEHYLSHPIITGDSRQTKAMLARRLDLVDAIHHLCGVIKEHILPKLQEIADWYFPGQRRTQDEIHRRIRKYLSRELEEYPNFDFLGLFTTIAVKEGSSERVHVDWGDNLHRYAFVFTAGDYIGGDFCVPQLGNRIAVPPGAVLAARTRLLAHCSTPAQGRRLVFTCFVDSMVFEHIFK